MVLHQDREAHEGPDPRETTENTEHTETIRNLFPCVPNVPWFPTHPQHPSQSPVRPDLENEKVYEDENDWDRMIPSVELLRTSRADPMNSALSVTLQAFGLFNLAD